ncbi:major histocompatibility complex class I-related gene protein-like isoform X2 [Clupea harengus]|uniref:Major histocompatibility complex class I-related gene protein-like isoform X2 n=1 Tax=Clupea harengus TaxID=7950 RepID=A0A6P8FRC2_CLUHA|nr:major histocompatibility complex class I-related gene protein-like isoform X2 [Clupea harengus]
MDLLTLICLLLFVLKTDAGSHSLLVFATFIIGDTPFPEFSAVVMLDDVQLGYYDSNVRVFILRGLKSEPEDVTLQEDAGVVFGHVNRGMKYRASHLKQRFNHTGGVHVQQRITGCELLEDDQPGPMAIKDAFNGQSGDQLSFTNDQHSFWSQWQWPAMWDKLQLGQVKWLYENLYHPICLRTLRTNLKKQKNRVMRKVQPRVRLLQKTLPDSGGAKVTCLATGFYPRHINLTLLRDGQPVSDHQITGGELLPNGDETYQMRKSLEVSAEELQKHLFTCTAEHLSMDNKINVNIDTKPELDDLTSVITVIVVVIGACLIVLAAAIYLMWQRKGSRTSPQSSYTSASSEDERGMPLEPVTS